MAAASFVMSGAMVAGTVVFYTRIPSITKHYINQLKVELTGMVTELVPAEINDAMPEIPTQTGPAMPIKLP